MNAILNSTGLTPPDNPSDQERFYTFFGGCQRFHDDFALGYTNDDDFSYIQKRFDRLIKELRRKNKSVTDMMEFMMRNLNAV